MCAVDEAGLQLGVRTNREHHAREHSESQDHEGRTAHEAILRVDRVGSGEYGDRYHEPGSHQNQTTRDRSRGAICTLSGELTGSGMQQGRGGSAQSQHVRRIARCQSDIDVRRIVQCPQHVAQQRRHDRGTRQPDHRAVVRVAEEQRGEQEQHYGRKRERDAAQQHDRWFVAGCLEQRAHDGDPHHQPCAKSENRGVGQNAQRLAPDSSLHDDEQTDDQCHLDHQKQRFGHNVLRQAARGIGQRLPRDDRRCDDDETDENPPVKRVPAGGDDRGDEHNRGGQAIEEVAGLLILGRNLHDNEHNSEAENRPRSPFQRAFRHANITVTTVVNPPFSDSHSVRYLRAEVNDLG